MFRHHHEWSTITINHCTWFAHASMFPKGPKWTAFETQGPSVPVRSVIGVGNDQSLIRGKVASDFQGENVQLFPMFRLFRHSMDLIYCLCHICLIHGIYVLCILSRCFFLILMLLNCRVSFPNRVTHPNNEMHKWKRCWFNLPSGYLT